MSNVRPFQFVLIAFFVVLAIVAIVFLTTYQAQKTESESTYGESILIWGTLSQEVMKNTIQEIGRTNKAFGVVEYRQFDVDTFNDELVNAIAESRSPDLIVLSSPSLVSLRSKILPIPYKTITERSFKDAYIDGASIFALQDGVYGIPFAVDPLVMYWNPTLFASNGLAEAPKNWAQIVLEAVPKITIRDPQHNILQGAVSFGGYSNVVHPKELLIALAWQLGSSLVYENNAVYTVALDDPVLGAQPAPFQNVVDFYTSFSSFIKNAERYSWNKAMPSDVNQFVSGDLALYFGLGSEYKAIENKNPNLGFDIAQIPQAEGATIIRTYGDFYAFAIPKAAKNAQASFAVATILANSTNAEPITQGLQMAPVRRDLVSKIDANPYRQVILKSALVAHGWLDPDPEKSADIFREMVDSINGDGTRLSEAVQDAIHKLSLVF